MRAACMFPALAAASLLCGAVLDRVAVSVGTQVITESQLTEEIKLDAFLNEERPIFTREAKRAAADRLIEQKLINKEMEMGRYPGAPVEEASEMIENLLKTRARSKSEFDSKLKAAGITFEELQAHLLWGLTLTHFVDLRFRPAVQVTRRDIDLYFRTKVLPGSLPDNAPKLEDFRAQIEKTLMAQRSDEQLDAWLKETRGHTEIIYAPEVFAAEAVEAGTAK